MKFFPICPVDSNPKGVNVFWAEILKRAEVVSSLDKADCIAFNSLATSEFENEIKKLKSLKPVVALWDTDSTYRLDQGSLKLLLFRTSLMKSAKCDHEFCLPSHLSYSWLSQDKESFWDFEPEFSTTPTLSYCGRASSPPIRKELIDFFTHESMVSFSCIPRDRFIKRLSLDASTLREVRKEYIDSLKSSTFSLCVRGNGNWSIRFYESLKMGRIPVLLDTDCVLPFESFIDWNQHIIASRSKRELTKKILDWHSKGYKYIVEKQKKCKDIWNKFLSVEGFSEHLLRTVSAHISEESVSV